MHSEANDALRRAISELLPIADTLTAESIEPVFKWRKSADGQWTGADEGEPDLRVILHAARIDIERVGSQFVRVFLTHHPEFGGLVGTASLGSNGLLSSPYWILNYALGEIWERHHTFQIDQDALATVVAEFASFVDNPTIRIRFSAQLLNFYTTADRIELPNGLAIRRMSEEELSAVSARSMFQPRVQGLFGIHEFVIEGEYDEPKVLGEQHDGGAAAQQYQGYVRQTLEKAIMALRTFKQGRVGYDFVGHRTVTFCPLPMPAFGSGDLYIPIGRYDLSHDEIDGFKTHADGIFAVTDPALQMACSRLSDAQIRNRPQDQLVDAVIGLEAVLLAALKQIEGELKFRFSLNFAMLHEGEEEKNLAYRIAKDLYDLRSRVAHGRTLGDKNRVGNESLSGNDAAKRSCEALRFVIMHFLGEDPNSSYKDSTYWERKYFGRG